ncbi:(4Fe-4S)-binding protein [Aestuariivivens marinum]|uniref:(4Fe-4S)-binding protein n=1 Tax=Aestuariivivens marinum TaxID=2913555 RepID=UPI001F57250E|nr:(4Fe-4S)-binding protein [Aestuariivivens marinum]
MGVKRKYTNGEVTVVWEAEKCVHSGICAKGLPQVFRPSLRPWVRIDAADTDTIINQVKQCPSGALSCYLNNKPKEPINKVGVKVEVMANGPLLVHGNLEVTYKDGTKEEKRKITAFCRCGHSNNKPFCDGSHSRNGFVG